MGTKKKKTDKKKTDNEKNSILQEKNIVQIIGAVCGILPILYWIVDKGYNIGYQNKCEKFYHLPADGHRLPYDEICSGRQNLTRHRMDLPHHLFLFCCKNYKRNGRRYFPGNRIKKRILCILHRVPAILLYSL